MDYCVLEGLCRDSVIWTSRQLSSLLLSPKIFYHSLFAIFELSRILLHLIPCPILGIYIFLPILLFHLGLLVEWLLYVSNKLTCTFWPYSLYSRFRKGGAFAENSCISRDSSSLIGTTVWLFWHWGFSNVTKPSISDWDHKACLCEMFSWTKLMLCKDN